MKKKILLSSLLFAGLFLGVNSVQAAPHRPGPGGPHGGPHGAPHMHRPPMHHTHMHHPPRIHHHHHVRHSSGFISPCYYGSYYTLGLPITRTYYPHHGHLGATFHISL